MRDAVSFARAEVGESGGKIGGEAAKEARAVVDFAGPDALDNDPEDDGAGARLAGSEETSNRNRLAIVEDLQVVLREQIVRGPGPLVRGEEVEQLGGCSAIDGCWERGRSRLFRQGGKGDENRGREEGSGGSAADVSSHGGPSVLPGENHTLHRRGYCAREGTEGDHGENSGHPRSGKRPRGNSPNPAGPRMRFQLFEDEPCRSYSSQKAALSELLRLSVSADVLVHLF